MIEVSTSWDVGPELAHDPGQRAHTRKSSAVFDVQRAARFDEARGAALLRDAGIVCHRGKIEVRAMGLVDDRAVKCVVADDVRRGQGWFPRAGGGMKPLRLFLRRAVQGELAMTTSMDRI